MQSQSGSNIDVDRYGPWCLIAGASEGIGAAFATQLAEQGFNLFLIARRRGLLEEFASTLRDQHQVEVRTLSADLSDPETVKEVARQCADIEIGLLIYNAGAVPRIADFLDQPEGEAVRTAYLNVIGQTVFADKFGRDMRRRGRGGIILLSSTASISGLGRLATYAASKAYSQIFAEGLWYELKPYGVDVLGLVATTTRTPQVQQIGMPLDDPDYPAVEPEQVAAEGLAQLGKGPIYYMDGSEEMARTVMAMPRAEAVTFVSEGVKKILPTTPLKGDQS